MFATKDTEVIYAQMGTIAKHTEEQSTQFILPELTINPVKRPPFQFSLPYVISDARVREELEGFVKEDIAK
jgi:hypothetical protein